MIQTQHAVRGQLPSRNLGRFTLLCISLAIAVALFFSGDVGASGYHEPTEAMTRILNSESLPQINARRDGDWILLTHRSNAPAIDSLAAPGVSVGAYRVDPNTNGWIGGGPNNGVGLTLVRASDRSRWNISVPEGGISTPVWSPDGARFAFTHRAPNAIELWLGDVATKTARLVAGAPLMGLQSRGLPCVWMPNSRELLCQLIPRDRGERPATPLRAVGPVIETSQAGEEQHSAVQPTGNFDSAYTEALYQYYWTTQLTLIDALTGELRNLGRPAIYETFMPSPDGRYVFSSTIVQPFSRTSSVDSFPRAFEILNLRGEVVRALGGRSLGRWGGVLSGWAPPGYRRFSWVPHEPATLAFVEALDGGDYRSKVARHDRLLRLAAPFRGRPVELFKASWRLAAMDATVTFTSDRHFANLAWLEGGGAWVEEIDYPSKRKRTWIVNTSTAKIEPQMLFDFDIEDRQVDPGSPMLTSGFVASTSAAEPMIRQDGADIYLSGAGSSPSGDRPFLDRLNLDTRRKQRLYQSGEGRVEKVIDVLNPSRVLTRSESALEPPNYWVVDVARGAREALTSIPHPVPELQGVRMEVRHYRRDDGVQLSGTLLLPSGYSTGQRIPVLVWAYPTSISSARNAAAVRGSPNQFLWTPSDPLKLAVCLLTASGYGVFWHAGMPVIGDADANDTAVSQLVANAEAAVRELTDSGIADPSRIAIAGHSYGGSMAAILLARSNLFAAGIAIDGAYNFTLTPVGFAKESRTLWEAPDAYLQLSALLDADRIRSPLLLIHGERDSAHATPVSESQRMHAALVALGRESRLVVLPYEDHAPAARESIGHVAWEIKTWLDRYLQHADRAGTPRAADSLQEAKFAGAKPAVAEAFIGVRVLKNKGAGDLDWSAELPPDCIGCRLVINEKTSTENPKELYFHFIMPGTLDRVGVRVKVNPKKVRGVVAGRTHIPFTTKSDGIAFEVPRHRWPEGGESALHTYIDTTGVCTRVEHADEERRYGPYSTGKWPVVERQAALNLEFAAREAINALGVDRTMQERGLGVIQIMGFDTNYPTLGPDEAHADSPPHWHMHVYWGGNQETSFVVPHHYIDSNGLLTHNRVGWRGPATNPAQKVGRFERGQTHETLTRAGEILFTHTITPEGYFEFSAAAGKCLFTPVTAGFHSGVDLKCDNGSPARRIRVDDHLAKGRLRVFINNRLADDYFYDTDTFVLKRSVLTHER